MLVRSVLLMLAAMATPAAAQQAATPAAPSLAERLAAAPSLEGSWGLKIDDVVILGFVLRPTPEGWSGTWLRPRSFASNGVLFTHVEGPAMAIRASSVRAFGGWTELTFDDPRPGAVPDVFRLRALPGGKVEAIYVGTGFAPFVLERMASDATIGAWPAGKTYQLTGVTAAPGASIVTFSISAPPAIASEPVDGRATRPSAAAPAVEGR